jgi:type IV pilus assembly protein PilM
MALPYFANGKKEQRMLAVDLGSRTTKAVQLERRGESFVLSSYALLDAPIFEKNLSPDLLAEHLKAVIQAINPKTKSLAMTVGVTEALVRHAEMPRMPAEDMRMVLKLNSKTYLQQDLTNYVYDIHMLPIHPPKGADAKIAAATGPQKMRVLVAGAKKQLVDDLQTGARNAGLMAEHIVPAIIGPANAFERALPEVFAKEVVALVDLGFKSSSISIMQQGEFALSRVVAIGGDKLTNGLAEILGVSYAEAEGIKVGMPGEVQSHLETLLAPLARELRASIDFYEHQSDRAVTQVFVAGGSARSELIVQRLQTELMVECKVLNPASFLQMELPPQQMADIEQVTPQLAVALGAALGGI